MSEIHKFFVNQRKVELSKEFYPDLFCCNYSLTNQHESRFHGEIKKIEKNQKTLKFKENKS